MLDIENMCTHSEFPFNNWLRKEKYFWLNFSISMQIAGIVKYMCMWMWILIPLNCTLNYFMLYIFYYIKIIIICIVNQSPCFMYLPNYIWQFWLLSAWFIRHEWVGKKTLGLSLLCQENICVMTQDTVSLHFAPPLPVLENQWADSLDDLPKPSSMSL